MLRMSNTSTVLYWQLHRAMTVSTELIACFFVQVGKILIVTGGMLP